MPLLATPAGVAGVPAAGSGCAVARGRQIQPSYCPCRKLQVWTQNALGSARRGEGGEAARLTRGLPASRVLPNFLEQNRFMLAFGSGLWQ